MDRSSLDSYRTLTERARLPEHYKIRRHGRVHTEKKRMQNPHQPFVVKNDRTKKYRMALDFDFVKQLLLITLVIYTPIGATVAYEKTTTIPSSTQQDKAEVATFLLGISSLLINILLYPGFQHSWISLILCS